MIVDELYKKLVESLRHIVVIKEQEYSIIAASKARKEYARMVKNIMSDPENWHRLFK